MNIQPKADRSGKYAPGKGKTFKKKVLLPTNFSHIGAAEYNIEFVNASSEVFDEVFHTAVGNQTNEDLKKVVKVYEDLKSLQDQTQTFINDKTYASALDMGTTYNNIKGNLSSLAETFGEEQGKADPSLGYTKTDVGLAENNKKLLDKMIEEVILKSIQEGK